MILNIHTLSGNFIKININDYDNVLKIKRIIEREFHHPIFVQKLLYKNKEICNYKQIKYYNISDNDHLHMVFNI